MNRLLLVKLALAAYPGDVRGVPDAEVVGTVLDASQDSLLRFAWELWSLVWSGLALRTRQALKQPLWLLVADAFGYAALIWCVLTPVLNARMSWPPPGWIIVRYDLWMVGLLAAALLYALGLRRAAGLLGIASMIDQKLADHLLNYTYATHTLAAPMLLGFAVWLVLGPRPQLSLRDRDWRLVALLAVVLLTFALPHTRWYALIALGLLSLPLKPALALGAALALVENAAINVILGARLDFEMAWMASLALLAFVFVAATRWNAARQAEA